MTVQIKSAGVTISLYICRHAGFSPASGVEPARTMSHFMTGPRVKVRGDDGSKKGIGAGRNEKCTG